jgi:hypothetical protein
LSKTLFGARLVVVVDVGTDVVIVVIVVEGANVTVVDVGGGLTILVLLTVLILIVVFFFLPTTGISGVFSVSTVVVSSVVCTTFG